MHQDDISAGGMLTAVSANIIGAVDNTVPTIRLSDAFEAGFYDALGRVAVAFGRLEYSGIILMKRLRQAERQRLGQPVKSFDEAVLEDLHIKFEDAERDAPALYAALIADPARQAVFLDLVARARCLWKTERNDCLHCCWTVSHDGRTQRLRPKKVQDKAGYWVLTWEPSGTVKVEELLGIAQRVEETALQIRRATEP
jgi:hypothetical protein